MSNYDVRTHRKLKKGTHKLIANFQEMCEDFGTHHTAADLTSLFVTVEISPHFHTHTMGGLIWHAPNEQEARKVFRAALASQYAHKGLYKQLYDVYIPDVE